MKINSKKIAVVSIAVSLVVVFVVAQARAASGFPEVMSGNTTVTINGQTVYGGLNGNYAILNSDTSASYGFKKSTLYSSCLSDTAGPVCFILGTGVDGSNLFGTQGGRLMTAKTTIDGDVVYEIPALLFSGLNINGDVSGDDLGYLKFWSSANLLRGNGTTGDGVGWNLGNYAFNPKAQVKLDSELGKQYSAKLATLAGSGTILTASAFSLRANYYLQAGGSAIFTNSVTPDDSAKYPDGKVWVINGTGTTTINFDATYHGKGTIIINGGNLVVNQNTDLQAEPSTDSRLGIIVLKNGNALGGNCTFNGNNKVQAMVFCENKFTALGNGEFTGSFVASDFEINPSSSVLFSYDPAFDSSQPPGFRNLAMPGTKEVGNQP
ncbi:MAG: hypothetical protein Q7S80_02790 [bacterium]|nr:hypothetical protein [bacterium]